MFSHHAPAAGPTPRRWAAGLAASWLGLSAGAVVAPGPAGAAPSAPSAGRSTVCTVGDKRLHEMSGLVTVGSGYAVVNDSNPDPAAIRIFFLDGSCRLTRSVSYPSAARDPEDLAAGADGTLWVADTGDNANAKTHRSSVAVWRLAPGATRPVLYRLAYPDGHHDAEAMLIDHDNLPVIITKEVTGVSHAYKPAAALAAGGDPVPLRAVGRVSARITGTANPFGLPGQLAITGAGVSPDRRRVVLRTYADAYEFDVPDGDVVAAVTTGRPRLTPLPDEPQGESIAYSADGTDLLTVSDASGPTPLLRWHRAAEPADSPAAGASASAGDGSAVGGSQSAAGTASDLAGAARDLAGRRGGSVLAGVATAVGAVLVLALMILRRRARGD